MTRLITDWKGEKTMTKDEALKMAIEALEACKEALDQPQPRLFLDLSNSHGNHPVEQPTQECVYCKQREVNFDEDDDFDSIALYDLLDEYPDNSKDA
jgi:hypothetical protein